MVSVSGQPDTRCCERNSYNDCVKPKLHVVAHDINAVMISYAVEDHNKLSQD